MDNEIKVDLSKWTGERVIWNNPSDHIKEFRQCSNYYFEAMELAKNKIVIDVACGSGFGTFLLSLVASETHGIDVVDHGTRWDALGKASPHLVNFQTMDLEKEPVDITADLAVSIETIEHLANPDYFLSNLKAKSLFFTIPCYGNKNEFHKIEYSEQSAKELIERHFPILSYHMEKGHMIGIAHKKE